MNVDSANKTKWGTSGGCCFLSFIDIDGNQVERTKHTHPYSYDPYVLHDFRGEKGQQRTGAYSDRLMQWDFPKHDKLLMKHFGDKGQHWSKREPSGIESFLRDYYDDQTINLVVVLEGCNVGNGYPYWYFAWN